MYTAGVWFPVCCAVEDVISPTGGRLWTELILPHAQGQLLGVWLDTSHRSVYSGHHALTECLLLIDELFRKQVLFIG